MMSSKTLLIKACTQIIPVLVIVVSTGMASDILLTGITIVGNDHTREAIIRREIQHPLNAPFDPVVIEQDRDRLENMGIFSMVKWNSRSLSDSTVEVTFFVIETWRLLPGLSPVYDEKTGWSLSGMLIINNFRGRNQTLTLNGIVGGISSYSLGFYDPWISGDRISLSTDLNNQRYDHLYLPYTVYQLATDAALGKIVNDHHKLRLKTGIEAKRYYASDDTTSFGYWYTSTTYAYDTRDIYTDPSQGILYRVNINFGVDYNSAGQTYMELINSISRYRQLLGQAHKLVAAGNLYLFSRFGFTDPLLGQYLGGAYSVRGWTPPGRATWTDPDQAYRFGQHWLVGSIELRQTIIPKFVTAMHNESGLTAAVFFDFGYITDDLASLMSNKPLIGVGLGLRIPMPMLENIRIDYGWGYYKGEFRDDQFHLAFGQKF